MYGHLGQREPVVQPATLGIVAILRGRVFVVGKESEKWKGGDEGRLA